MIKKKLLLVFLMPLLFLGCSNKSLTDDKQNEEINKTQGGRKITVWTTYWDTEDLQKEIGKISGNIENISYFAAYFDKDKQLFIPKEVDETYEMVKNKYPKNNYGSYISFVNDLIKKDNTSSLKDTELLYDLLSSDSDMDRHIQDILKLATRNNYKGIEIDYEGMKQDIELWNLFSKFIEELFRHTNKKDLELRILLEPNFPIDLITLPEGPEYVIMCYNLYGNGTIPGSKADKEFILKMIEKMEKLSNNINFAMSSGGFKFYNENVDQLSERQAVELAKMYNSEILRDKESKALFFSYIDGGVEYEVWYADYETLDFWFSIVEGSGDYGLSLWRLGGNITLDL